MKKTAVFVSIICLVFLLSGCFVLDHFFPPIGGGTSRLALYMNYNKLNLEAHRLDSVRVKLNKVELLSGSTVLQTNDAAAEYSISLRPDVVVNSMTTFLQLIQDNNLAQFDFENETDEDKSIKNPSVRLTFDASATAVYRIYNEAEETYDSASVALTIPTGELSVSIPLKELTNQYKNKTTLSLPKGQSTLFILLNLEHIPTLAAAQEQEHPIALTHGFINSISMIQDDACVVYGRIEDTEFEDTPKLEKGQAWTLSFYDVIFLGEKDFSVSAYSMTTAQTKNQNYYFVVPSNSYTSSVYLRVPGAEDEDDINVEVTLEDQKREIAAEMLYYPEKMD